MAERIELQREEEPEPERRLTESEKPQRSLLRLGLACLGLAALIGIIVFAVGRIGIARETGEVYRALQQERPAAAGVEAEIRALAATLSPRQVRALVARGALDYDRLTDEQQRLFAGIAPLPEPDAPTVVPHQIRLADLGGGKRELRVIWAAPGTGQAVVERSRL